jgi:hypothetical protein
MLIRNRYNLFCFSCFTDLAYAVIDTLKHEYLYNGMITKHQKKSKKRIETPLLVPALKIMEKYS